MYNPNFRLQENRNVVPDMTKIVLICLLIAASTGLTSCVNFALANSANNSDDNQSSLLGGSKQNYEDGIGSEYENNTTNSKNSNKLVIINFDDSYENQIRYAKPILDKYGFNATFFEVCERIDNPTGWWILQKMQKEGMDIQAHTMTHPNVDELSRSMLDTELRKAKECFLNNGINATIFAYPNARGWNNETVLHEVARNYDLARTDSDHPLTFLNCDLWNGISYGIEANDSSNTLPSCELSGLPLSSIQQTFGSSRYAINSLSQKHIVGDYDYSNSSCIGPCEFYNNSQMLDRFIQAVNSQTKFNEDGTIRAIPIIIYHDFVQIDDISKNDIPTDTSVNLFDLEMKYLHDNGFKVVTMKDLRYHEQRGTLCIAC
jgi:peptidoglycan/xylan/chitin deacetylase (PgdA/CDA1 family)